MLLVDPLKRYTIPEIKQHPWFQFRLPHYLAVPLADTAQQARRIDEDGLQKVVKLGFDRNRLVNALQSRVRNKGTVTFYLMLDNSRRASNDYMAGDLVEAGVDRSQPRAVDMVGSSSMRMHDSGRANNRLPRLQPERKWALGLQSHAHPKEIMAEVLKVLQELAVGWKKIGRYNMKCRWFPLASKDKLEHRAFQAGADTRVESRALQETQCGGADDQRRDDRVVKFEVQLYKIKEGEYLLDLQRVGGSHFLFLDLCASILEELRVL